MSETQERKKAPDLDLRNKVGNYVIAEFINRYESKTFPGTYSALLKVEETNGNTTLWDKETDTKVEVSIEEGDQVFFRESRWLTKFMGQRKNGQRIKLTYTGKSKPKVKGYKPTFEYDMEVLGPKE